MPREIPLPEFDDPVTLTVPDVLMTGLAEVEVPPKLTPAPLPAELPFNVTFALPALIAAEPLKLTPMPLPLATVPVKLTAPVEVIVLDRFNAGLEPDPLALIVTPPVPELTAAVW